MAPPSDHLRQVSVASAQGERHHQEDRAVCEWIESPSGTGWLLAVFDGHGGIATANAASQALLSLFKSDLQSQNGNVPHALRQVVASLNETTRHHGSGSTASIVFIPQDAQNIYLAVLGDSPIAILDAQRNVHIGPNHNVRTNAGELAAAETRGGVLKEGYLEDSEVPDIGLQFARALGDVKLSRVLSREPDIETVPLGGRGIVLVGTDGLLLPHGNANADQLKRLLTLIEQGSDAKALVKDALARRTGDNVTAIVWESNF